MNLSCCKSYCAEVLGMRHKKTSSDDHKAHIRAGSATYSLTVGGMTVSRIVGRSEFSMVRTPDRISDGGHMLRV